MRLLFGLGNPGNRYNFTRHNVGFLVLDFIANQLKYSFLPGRGDYLFCEASIADTEVMLVKPTTYMNHSGLAVKQACEFFETDIEQIIIVYDDFNIDFGRLRFRSKGAGGGHRGMESVIYHLQSEQVKRLRVGIGNEFENSIDFVLSGFSEEEKKGLPLLLKAAMEGLTTYIKDGIEKSMNYYNRNVLVFPDIN